MRKKVKYFYLLCIFFVFSCYSEEALFEGTWFIENPPKDFRGTSKILIMKKNEQYSIELNDVLLINAVYQKDENSLVFKIIGLGPDGPEEKVILRKNKLVRLTLTEGKWIEGYQYYKENP